MLQMLTKNFVYSMVKLQKHMTHGVKIKQLLEKNLLILLFILWDYPKFLILI